MKLSPRKSPRKRLARLNQYEMLRPWDDGEDAVEGYLIKKKLAEAAEQKGRNTKKRQPEPEGLLRLERTPIEPQQEQHHIIQPRLPIEDTPRRQEHLPPRRPSPRP